MSCLGRRERTRERMSHFTRANKSQYRKAIFPAHPGFASAQSPSGFPSLARGWRNSELCYCTGVLLDSKQTWKSLQSPFDCTATRQRDYDFLSLLGGNVQMRQNLKNLKCLEVAGGLSCKVTKRGLCTKGEMGVSWARLEQLVSEVPLQS